MWWPFKRKLADVPYWADFFSPKEYADFIAAVEAHFRRRGIAIRIEDGVVYPVEPTGQRWNGGLLNLAQICHQLDRAAWRELIERHFASLEQLDAEDTPWADQPFEKVEPLLAVRLWPDDYLTSVPESKIIFREDLHGTITGLVLDLPDAVRALQPEEAARWGRSEEELFSIGVRNLQDKPRDPIDQRFESLRVVGFVGENFFVATQALLLHRYPELIGTHGSLVAIPHRHALLCCPIEDVSALGTLGTFIGMACGMYREGPGSITQNIYWYDDGVFVNLPYESGGDQLRFMPPEEFVRMMNTLAPED